MLRSGAGRSACLTSEGGSASAPLVPPPGGPKGPIVIQPPSWHAIDRPTQEVLGTCGIRHEGHRAARDRRPAPK
jgi:hypothetical protein